MPWWAGIHTTTTVFWFLWFGDELLGLMLAVLQLFLFRCFLEWRSVSQLRLWVFWWMLRCVSLPWEFCCIYGWCLGEKIAHPVLVLFFDPSVYSWLRSGYRYLSKYKRMLWVSNEDFNCKPKISLFVKQRLPCRYLLYEILYYTLFHLFLCVEKLWRKSENVLQSFSDEEDFFGALWEEYKSSWWGTYSVKGINCRGR